MHKSLINTFNILAVTALLSISVLTIAATVVMPEIANNGITTLDGAISDSDTTITVDSVSALGLSGSTTDAYVTIIDNSTRGYDPLIIPETNEIVRITGVSGNVLTVTRAQGSTTAKAFSDGDVVELRIVADNLQRLYDSLTDGTDSISVDDILAGGTVTATGNITGANLTGTNTGDQNAAGVSIADAGGIITGTDVEAALQENRTAIDLNTAKTSNATHTGEVTGSGALTLDKTAISNKTAVTIDGADYIIIGDSSDSDNLKKGLASDLLGGGDHGTLTGLGDDDHTQYVLADGSRDIASDTDLDIDVGRLTVSSPTTDEMTIAHVDSMSSTTYALKQTAAGVTTINSGSGDSLSLRQAGVSKLDIDSTGNVTVQEDFDVVGTSKHGGTIMQDRGTDIASAATLGITETGNYFQVTGTTGITAIGSVNSTYNTEITLEFTGILTITHGASLQLPGDANITTAAGDVGKFTEISSGVWVCTNWQSAIGAGGGDALVSNPLSQFAATTSAQLAGVISDETGTGAVVLANAPALINPTGIDTGDVSEVTDKNYVTDAEATVIGNTSGYNSGDIPEASQTWVIDSPAVGGIYGPRIDTARTIDRVQIWTDTGTVDLNVEIRTAPNTSGTNSMTSDLQATSSSVAQTTFADDTIAAGEYLYIDISAVASSPTVLGVTVSYE